MQQQQEPAVAAEAEATRDQLYCHFVARRAVARAALHLGLEAMSKEALDVLADVVLEYIQRIGHTTAIQVEASNRSSAHVNVLDALRAVQVCTTAAVQHVHPTHTTTTTTTTTSSDGMMAETNAAAAAATDDAAANSITAAAAAAARSNGTQQQQQLQRMDWKGLAAFLFGPDWHLVDTAAATSRQQQQAVIRPAAAAAGGSGKVGPSSTSNDVVEVTTTTTGGYHHALSNNNNNQGWDAPYPEEIPNFPLASDWVANPHPLTHSQAAESLHTAIIVTSTDEQQQQQQQGGDNDIKDTGNQEEEEAADNVFPPDAFYTAGWGSLDQPAPVQATSAAAAMPIKDSDVVMEDAAAAAAAAAKRKRDDDTTTAAAEMQEPVAKKQRVVSFAPTTESKIQKSTAATASPPLETTEDETSPLLLLLPQFYPPLPRASENLRRTILDVDQEGVVGPTTSAADLETTTTTTTTRKKHKSSLDTEAYSTSVRSALVQLGKQHLWGSDWDHDDDYGDNNNNDDKSNRRQMASLSEIGPGVTAGAASASAEVTSHIVPLGRASGSRVSRILEGSMDTPQP